MFASHLTLTFLFEGLLHSACRVSLGMQIVPTVGGAAAIDGRDLTKKGGNRE